VSIGNRKGFTFIELAVVMTILMAVAAIAVPRLLSWADEGNMGAECRRLAGVMRYVRNEAVRRQRSLFLAISTEERAYWVETRRDPSEIEKPTFYTSWDEPVDTEYEPYEDDFVGRHELRQRLVFDRVVFDDGSEEQFATARIEFRPDGTSQTAAVYMMLDEHRKATVMINGDTGRVKVFDSEEELEPRPVLYEDFDLEE
jgi:prepilin-type N-terminal cleavage/methylation domain-containing protein